MALQCLPLSGGDQAHAHGLVDKAIEVLDQSGLAYTVGPFETVVEGPLEELFACAAKAHQAIIDAGSPVASYIKIFSSQELASSQQKTAKFRAQGH